MSHTKTRKSCFLLPKKQLTGSLLLMLSFCVYAQEARPVITFERPHFDFKEIKEMNGPYTHVFHFVNEGMAPLQISEVSSSCGCTTPAWTTASLSPGDSGFIVAEFNPLNRPGAFDKRLKVMSNAKNGDQELSISGVVIPRPRTIFDDYPHQMGNLLSDKKYMNFGLILSNARVKHEMKLYNHGDRAIEVRKINIPDYVSVGKYKSVLQPEESMILYFFLDAAAHQELGHVTDEVSIVTSDSIQAIKRFKLTAAIQEYFPPLSEEEIAMKPKLQIEDKIRNLGDVKEGDIKILSFEIRNDGLSNLNIRGVKTSCDCLSAEVSSYDIAAGEVITLDATFDTSEKRGSQFKTIYIFSNDTDVSTEILIIRANVINLELSQD